MRRPPDAVVFVARTHWLVGAVMLASTLVLHWLVARVPRIEFGPSTYLILGAIASLYLAAGTLVWFGLPVLGPLLSRVCSLLYLPRPNMGTRIWDTMNSPDFKAHFRRSKQGSPPA